MRKKIQALSYSSLLDLEFCRGIVVRWPGALVLARAWTRQRNVVELVGSGPRLQLICKSH